MFTVTLLEDPFAANPRNYQTEAGAQKRALRWLQSRAEGSGVEILSDGQLVAFGEKTGGCAYIHWIDDEPARRDPGPTVLRDGQPVPVFWK